MLVSKVFPVIIFGWHGKEWGWLPLAKCNTLIELIDVCQRLIIYEKWRPERLYTWDGKVSLPKNEAKPPGSGLKYEFGAP